MKKQAGNHQYRHETAITCVIRNMTIYTEQHVKRMIVQHMHQKRMKNIIQNHQQHIARRKKQDKQLEMQKKQRYLIK